ncbi:adenylyl-sulfate kinase [Polycladomyces subterraneus]|uniref:Adenylyl-sulfate kinase n=1 Tax=Polycladomyces subterraneus TaxID=1016997 RepID=A0ABT8ILT9_9BACL|nr:adenylyl-sulfate kinase [Polycladomyces subterraneus]MDN4593159.1 adenylyl-sulfate kinase [Polycladomyces subterraneus]
MRSKGVAVWLTGLSGSGKTTIAKKAETKLIQRGQPVQRLDGDVVRARLTKDLGFSQADRFTQVERVTYVAELLTYHGIIVLASLISPYRELRAYARHHIPSFVEVYVRCPLEECAKRDVKGLYARAFQGEIPHFTGVSDPYEEPENPELILDTQWETVDESVEKLLRYLERQGYISPTEGEGA